MYFYPYDYTTQGMGYDQDWDDDLERRFPPIYGRVYPWVNYFCCEMELKHGYDHEPSREELEEMVEKIYDKVKDHLDDDHDDDHKHRDDDRQFGFGFGGRGIGRDLIGIVLLNELLGRRDFRDRRFRRRRRRRRRDHHGHFPSHYGY